MRLGTFTNISARSPNSCVTIPQMRASSARKTYYAPVACIITFAAFGGGAVFTVVCLFVGLLGGQLKSYEWIFMKLGKQTHYGPEIVD